MNKLFLQEKQTEKCHFMTTGRSVPVDAKKGSHRHTSTTATDSRPKAVIASSDAPLQVLAVSRQKLFQWSHTCHLSSATVELNISSVEICPFSGFFLCTISLGQCRVTFNNNSTFSNVLLLHISCDMWLQSRKSEVWKHSPLLIKLHCLFVLFKLYQLDWIIHRRLQCS